LPYGYSIHKDKRLVVSTGSGVVTFAELKAHTDQLTNDPDFNPEFHQLVDATAMTGMEVSPDEARRLAQVNVFSPASRRALVAPSPSVFGMMRLWGTHHELTKTPSQVAVFYDISSALAWLGLEGEALK
jgi:hypothetical protein